MKADCFGPVWSPDGSRIAFVSARALDGSDATDPNDTSNIWVMNADGSGLTPVTRLTAAGAASTAPVWSPGGSKLAFESSGALDASDNPNTNITVNIWIMNADGTGLAALTSSPPPARAVTTRLGRQPGRRLYSTDDARSTEVIRRTPRATFRSSTPMVPAAFRCNQKYRRDTQTVNIAVAPLGARAKISPDCRVGVNYLPAVDFTIVVNPPIKYL